MGIFKSIFTPFVRGYVEAKETLTQEKADRAALEAALSAAIGVEEVLNIIMSEKKQMKEKIEKKQMREKLLNL